MIEVARMGKRNGAFTSNQNRLGHLLSFCIPHKIGGGREMIWMGEAVIG